jgi:hypothetical protein
MVYSGNIRPRFAWRFCGKDVMLIRECYIRDCGNSILSNMPLPDTQSRLTIPLLLGTR